MWFVWGPLFLIGAGLLGLSTLRQMRKQLHAAKLETRLPTALMGMLVLVILPLGAGALGAHFAWNRADARAVESVAIDEAAGSLRAALGEVKKLSSEDVRSLVRMFADERPLRERAFYVACELALSHGEINWDELVVKARLRLPEAIVQTAQPFAERAKRDLFALGIILVLVHGGTLTIVWFVCRKRLTVVK